MAVWFVAMLVVSILPAFAPTAVAENNPALVGATNLIIKRDVLRGGTGLWHDYGVADGPIRPGDVVRFFWNVTWPTTTCQDGGTGPTNINPQDSQWSLQDARINATVLGGAFFASVTERFNATTGTDAFTYMVNTTDITVTTAPEGNQSYAVSDNHRLEMNLTFRCHANPSAPSAPTAPRDHVHAFLTEAFAFDTQYPQLTLSTPWVDRAGSDAAGGSASIAPINSSVKFNVTSANEAATLLWDVSSVTTTAAFANAPSIPNVAAATLTGLTLPIKEAGETANGHTYRSLPNNPAATQTITIRATDAVGNTKDYTTAAFAVDNVRPNVVALTPNAGTAHLVLSARNPSIAGSHLNSFGTAFTATTASETIAAAQLRVVDASNVETAWGAFASGGSTTFSLPDDPLTLLDENQIGNARYFIVPVDAAGNYNNKADCSCRAEIVLPRMNVRYGPMGANPLFVSGNAIGNVNVNITANPPGLPFSYEVDPATTAENSQTNGETIYGELARVLPNGDLSFWRTTGNLAGSADTHFTTTENRDPIPASGDDASTIFRPASKIDGSIPVPISLDNLSTVGHTRNYLDGQYQLRVLARTAVGDVTHVMNFRIDSRNPAFVAHRNYTLGRGMPAGTSGVIHGPGDGNPVRLLINATDQYTTGTGTTDNPHVLTDSGLKNLTIEFMDTTETNLIPHAAISSVNPMISTTPGVPDRAVRFDITRKDCDNGNNAGDAAAGIVRTGLLPHCFDLVDWTDTLFTSWCPNTVTPDPANPHLHIRPSGSSPGWNATCFAYDNVSITGSWRTFAHPSASSGTTSIHWANQGVTFINRTAFAGWVNFSVPDLPTGQYKIRVLACDHAERCHKETHGTSATDYYKVAPVVRIVANADSPKLTENGGIDVTVLSGARFAEPVPDTVRDNCFDTPGGEVVRDVCPAYRVKVYVSNSDQISTSNVGVEYLSIQNFDGANRQTFNYDGAAPGSFEPARKVCEYEANPPSPATDVCFTRVNGSLAIAPRQVSLFQNRPIVARPLSEVPNGNTIKTGTGDAVYVRAVAESADGLVVNSTSWIRVTTLDQASIQINEPKLDWSVNRTNTNIQFNVSFDAKQLGPKPTMTLIVSRLNEQTGVWTRETALPNVTAFAAGSVPNAVVSYWTGTFQSSAPTVPGALRIDAVIFDSSSGTAVERGVASRYLHVVDPNAVGVAISDAELLNSNGTEKRGTTIYVGRNFELPFTINHGTLNLSAEKLVIKLHPDQGSVAEYTKDQDGFTYVLPFPTFDDGATSTSFIANITLPNGIRDRDSFRINITAQTDVEPHKFGNITRLITFGHDNANPTAMVDLEKTLKTVVDYSTTNPRLNRPATGAERMWPRFEGIVSDVGAGIANVEVRIYDKDGNFMLRTDATKAIGFNANDWIGIALPCPPDVNAGCNSPGANTYGSLNLGVPNSPSPGNRTWTYDADKIFLASGPDATHPLDLSHTFQVDVRATDGLGRVTETRTNVTFDNVAPFLGYGGRLNSVNALKAGIEPSAVSVDWHGSASLTVNVTDNHCIRAVRLIGKSDLRPDVILKANMTPVTSAADGSVCYSSTVAMPNTVTGGTARYSRFTLNLANAPNFTDEITNYTYWWEAEDTAGNLATIPANFQNFRMQVLDNTAATIRSIVADPPTGQAGGRTLFKVDAFDNLGVDRVTFQIRDGNSNALLANGTMKPPVNSTNGVGVWTIDTQEDLNFTLETRDYNINISAYDVNWNRPVRPTCPAGFCLGQVSIYRVRDDGAPSVSLVSPADNSTVNATPIFKLRALNKNLVQGDITIRAGSNESALTAIPASSLNFSELKGSTGARQGWDITFSPTGLADATNYTVNASASIGGLVAAQTFRFRVDALPPTVAANLTGNETIAGKNWGTAATRVALTANDTVSAAPTIKYSVNNGTEQTYTSPLTPAGTDGEWKLEYWAVDAAQNAAAKKSLTLTLDKTGPRITVSSSGDTVIFTVSEDASGVGLNESSVKVHYRYGETGSFTEKAAEKDTGNIFRVALGGNASSTGLSYYFSATDLLGNAATAVDAGGRAISTSSPATIPKAGTGTGGNDTNPPPNLAPTVQITSPAPGASLREFLDLKWLAEDPEGDTISITIALSDPVNEVISPGGENSGTFRLNLSGRPAGAYRVVVTASDGENTATDDLTFNIEAGEAIKPRTIPPPTVQADQLVSVAVAIEPTGKTVEVAQYRVLKDGELYRAGNLTVTGGVYGASFKPTEPGNYRVLLDVGYSDGTRDTSKQIATFTVPGSTDGGSAKVFPGSLIGVLALAGVTAALAAYGAFGRWKK